MAITKDMAMTNNYFSAAFRRCIDRLLIIVDDDPDFPSPDKLALIKQTQAKDEKPDLRYRRLLLELKESEQLVHKIPNPTLLRAAIRIQSDFPEDFIGDDVKRIEEKLRTGRASLRTKYWKQIIEAAMANDLGRGGPLPNHGVAPWGMNPLANAIAKGAQLVVSVQPEPELAFPKKDESKTKPGSLSAIQLTLIWVAVILCVRAIKHFIE